MICTCTYLKMQFPAILEQKTGFVPSLFSFFVNFILKTDNTNTFGALTPVIVFKHCLLPN